ncbi:hypothetical protein R9C00_11795 [Flammeovirgaceae bacterium SG7u.111]|nr:hypothetical protein [Flammeovirgaceae bacterium SG7u.132]WPO38135.1 hypothetical protein R9C00_11795 [Flammeovirgaceae bacterium SG7u.111]
MVYKLRWYNSQLKEQEKEIPERIYEDLKKAKAYFLFSIDLEEKIALVIDNYLEYETEILSICEYSRVRGIRKHIDMMNDRLKMDRRIINLLTSTRLFLDHTSHSLSKFYDKETIPRLFKQIRRQEYDKYFSYRFLEEFRNYVQHAKLPINIISYSGKTTQENHESYSRMTVKLLLDLYVLSEDKSFKKGILQEAQKTSSNNKIDLRPNIREYISCFIRIYKEIKKATHSDRIKYKKVLSDSFKEISSNKSKSIQYFELINEDNNSNHLNKVFFSIDLLEYFDFLSDKNKIHPNVEKSYSSNIL